MRLLLAILIIVCPSALGQTQIRCENGWCLIHRDALQILVEQAKLNCGPPR